MSLLEDLLSEGNFPKPLRATCGVCKLLGQLSKEESKALQNRLDNKNVSHVALHQVLKNNGYNISDSVIGRHRRKVCSGVVK